jgi:aarF domain-containing kinase
MHPSLRRFGIFVGVGAAGYLIDKHAYSSTLQRNLRTVWNACLIAADYKLNFNPGDSAKIDALHERVAQRMYNVCKENGGLYIKFGKSFVSLNE